MTNRSKKAAVTAGMLLHLVFIGLVGAATIILFSVASVSLLGTGKESLTGSSIGHEVLPYTGGNAAPIPAEKDSPTILPAVPTQGAPTSETPEVRTAKPVFDLPPPDRDASTTTLETRDAVPIGDPSAAETRSPEVSGSEQAAAEPLSVADKVSAAAPDASRRTVPRAHFR